MSVDSRKRKPTASEAHPFGAERRQLEERRRHALRDLEEVSEQVASGELDEATAQELRAGYEAELEAVEQALQRTKTSTRPAGPPPGRSPRRAMGGALLLIGAFTVVILLAARALRPEGGSQQPSDAPAAASEATTLEQMEEVLAAHPEVNAMRLALADRYFEQGDYSRALEHYLVVASSEATPEEESRALGRIGWMAYITGQVEEAERYLTASLDAEPDNVEGKLFLGLVRLYGLDDPAGAIPLLEDVVALPDLPPELRAEVERALEEARSAAGEP